MTEIIQNEAFIDKYSDNFGIKEMSIEATPNREMFKEQDFDRFGTLTRKKFSNPEEEDQIADKL